LLDQIPVAPTSAATAATRQRAIGDREIVRILESKLPPHAMLFQMPVADFPESPPINGMGDYEHFRPYLYSHLLRYSYGSDKGRSREAWQHEATQFGTAVLINILEDYGFSAVWINRQGYADGAASLLAEFRAGGRATLLAETPEFACVALTPSPRPTLPPEFDEGWYGLEGVGSERWRWSSGEATVVLYNDSSAVQHIQLVFGLETLKPRHIGIYSDREQVFACALDKPNSSIKINLAVTLQPGKNGFRFKTDAPGAPPGNGDLRVLAFRLTDFTASY
jgi:hypothetical protein